MKKILGKHFVAGERGASLVEYGLLGGLVSVVAIAAVLSTGEEVEETFCVAAKGVNSALAEAGVNEAKTFNCELGVAGGPGGSGGSGPEEGGGGQPDPGVEVFTPPAGGGLYTSRHLYDNASTMRYYLVGAEGQTRNVQIYVNDVGTADQIAWEQTINVTSDPYIFDVDLSDITANPSSPAFSHDYGRYGEFIPRLDGTVQWDARFRNKEPDVLLSSPENRLHGDASKPDPAYFRFGTGAKVQDEHDVVAFASGSQIWRMNGSGQFEMVVTTNDSASQLRTFAITPAGEIILPQGDKILADGTLVEGAAPRSRAPMFDEQANLFYAFAGNLGGAWIEVWDGDLNAMIARSDTWDGVTAYGDSTSVASQMVGEGPNHMVVRDPQNSMFHVFNKGRSITASDTDFNPSLSIPWAESASALAVGDDTLYTLVYRSGDQEVQALNLANGSQRFSITIPSARSNTGADAAVATSMHFQDGKLYVPVNEPLAYQVYNADTGAFIEEVPLDQRNNTNPANDNSSLTTTFMDADGSIWAGFGGSGIGPYGIELDGGEVWWVKN